MKTLLKEFKEFAVKGNVVDMAVGVIVGGAFGKIVTSLVNDVIMPLVGVLTGGIDFSNLFLPLDGNTYATLAEAGLDLPDAYNAPGNYRIITRRVPA